MKGRFRVLGSVAALVVVTTLSVGIAAHPSTVHAAPPAASAYVPVSPYRILDTRLGQGFPRRVHSHEAFTLPVANVPPGATAIVLNVAIDGSADSGYVTVYPTGVTRPVASSINVDGPGQTIANLVTVQIGAGGAVDVYSLMEADLVADVQGYYVPAATARAGRFTPVGPTRLVDTRQPGSPFGLLPANKAITVDIAGLGGLPADAIAAALKVTVTESAGTGYWTVYPAGSPRPTASNINVVGSGITIANQVLARLNGGQATVYSQVGGHVIIDLVGWFTGPSAQSSDAGLFVPVTPARLLDSREPPFGAVPGANRAAEVSIANRFGLPASGVGAVVVNATVTQTVGPGYFSIWPARTYRPNASSLNASHAGQTIANHVIAPVSTAGFSFYTQTGGHLIADIAGWYTGTEVAAVLPPDVPLTGVGGPSSGQPYSFSVMNHGAPLRWNPCQAIRYAINLGGYDPSERATINEAMGRLQAATGLMFVPAADTTYIPTSAAPTPDASVGADLVITLADETRTDLVPGSIVGRTDISYTSVIIKAAVVVDMGGIAGRPDWSGQGVGPVLLHELGHAVGLGHVSDATQIMNAVTSPGGPVTYSAGDLAGLWQVGAAQGCAA